MPDLSLETGLHRRGIRFVAGVDEAGRGPLAGPVVAAAVILPPDLTGSETWLQFLDDSKRLSQARRERAVDVVHRHALAVGVGMVGPEDIDAMGIGRAALAAMLIAVGRLPFEPGTCCWTTSTSGNVPLPMTPSSKGIAAVIPSPLPPTSPRSLVTG